MRKGVAVGIILIILGAVFVIYDYMTPEYKYQHQWIYSREKVLYVDPGSTEYITFADLRKGDELDINIEVTGGVIGVYITYSTGVVAKDFGRVDWITHGKWEAPEDGTYYLYFDNSFSSVEKEVGVSVHVYRLFPTDVIYFGRLTFFGITMAFIGIGVSIWQKRKKVYNLKSR